jgi:hypothetical protein
LLSLEKHCFILRFLSCIIIGVKNQKLWLLTYYRMLLETLISYLWSYGARSNADKCGFDRRLGRSNDYEINKRHSDIRTAASWIRIRIMCKTVATCLPIDCRFNELALLKSN